MHNRTVTCIYHMIICYDITQEHPVIIDQLDLVEEDDQITHFVTIEEQCDPEDHLSETGIVLYW